MKNFSKKTIITAIVLFLGIIFMGRLFGKMFKSYRTSKDIAHARTAIEQFYSNTTAVDEYRQKIIEINKEIEVNSTLRNYCQDNKGKMDITVTMSGATLTDRVNCHPLQTQWNADNKSYRSQIKKIENSICIQNYMKAQAANGMIRDLNMMYDLTDELYPMDTSCYDATNLAVNDSRRDQIITSVTIHHTSVESKDVHTAAESARRHHGVYPAHFFIDREGEVLDTRSIDQVVGSTRDPYANRHSIHIELVGNFNETQPSDKQMAALVKVMEQLQMTHPNITEILGHRHWNSPTACPGNFPFDKLIKMLSPKWNLSQGVMTELNSKREHEEEHAHDGPSTSPKPEPEPTPEPAQEQEKDWSEIAFAKQEEALWKVTVYNSFEGGHCPKGNINCSGNSLVPASGWTMDESMAGNIVACPPGYAFGTKFKLHHPELGGRTVTCFDRGGAIQGKRLDLWIGIAGRTVFPTTKTFYDVRVEVIS